MEAGGAEGDEVGDEDGGGEGRGLGGEGEGDEGGGAGGRVGGGCQAVGAGADGVVVCDFAVEEEEFLGVGVGADDEAVFADDDFFDFFCGGFRGVRLWAMRRRRGSASR